MFWGGDYVYERERHGGLVFLASLKSHFAGNCLLHPRVASPLLPTLCKANPLTSALSPPLSPSTIRSPPAPVLPISHALPSGRAGCSRKGGQNGREGKECRGRPAQVTEGTSQLPSSRQTVQAPHPSVSTLPSPSCALVSYLSQQPSPTSHCPPTSPGN